MATSPDAVTIEPNASFCLNEDSKHKYGNVFIGDETLYLKSDAGIIYSVYLFIFFYVISLSNLYLIFIY
jgi:hypothetical protein